MLVIFRQADSVYYTRAPGKYLYNPASWPADLLAKTSFWPNNPDELPSTEQISKIENTIT